MTFPSRIIFQVVDEPVTEFPRKSVALVASAQGTLTLETVVQTGRGDRLHRSHELQRCDALDLITALAEWVASPDSILREHPDGTPVAPFGPKDAIEARIFAEESFRVDVQVALHEHMQAKGVSAAELASRMDIPEARVRAFFDDACNVTVRDLARFYHALGLPPPSLRPSPVQTPPPAEHLAEAAAAALRPVRGLEAAFLLLADKTIYAVAREHEHIDRQSLLEAEERLAPWGDIKIHVAAHQGRDIDTLGFGSLQRIV